MALLSSRKIFRSSPLWKFCLFKRTSSSSWAFQGRRKWKGVRPSPLLFISFPTVLSWDNTALGLKSVSQKSGHLRLRIFRMLEVIQSPYWALVPYVAELPVCSLVRCFFLFLRGRPSEPLVKNRGPLFSETKVSTGPHVKLAITRYTFFTPLFVYSIF